MFDGHYLGDWYFKLLKERNQGNHLLNVAMRVNCKYFTHELFDYWMQIFCFGNCSHEFLSVTVCKIKIPTKTADYESNYALIFHHFI